MSCKAPQQKVFDLVADATSWPKWAGPVIRWGGWVVEGEPAPGGVGAIRKLGSKQLGTREQIIEYDPPHYMAYTILTPMPVRDYRAIVSIDPEGDGCRITWAASFEGKFPGAGAATAWGLKRFIGNLVVRLARYAETH
ncbi:MAG TPA: SRPBCC family protein [Mycobacteriales bacterium]|nr:SRPBCC family protein [Mycobacteriales bacterium]HWA66499.1 SRPBCC family protein [Mycobacteriales bacterium]